MRSSVPNGALKPFTHERPLCCVCVSMRVHTFRDYLAAPAASGVMPLGNYAGKKSNQHPTRQTSDRNSEIVSVLKVEVISPGLWESALLSCYSNQDCAPPPEQFLHVRTHPDNVKFLPALFQTLHRMSWNYCSFLHAIKLSHDTLFTGEYLKGPVFTKGHFKFFKIILMLSRIILPTFE